MSNTLSASERLNIRIPPHTKAVIEQASQLMGVSVSHYVLTTMYQHATNVLNHAPDILLSGQDSERIAALLDNPPPPNDKMKALLALTDGMADADDDI